MLCYVVVVNAMSISPQELDAAPRAHPWIVRVRVLLVAALVWSGFHYIVGPLAISGGAGHAAMLTGGGASFIAMIGAVIAAGVCVLVGTVLLRMLRVGADSLEPFVAIGIAVTLWAMPGGTIDQVLLSRLPTNDLSPKGVYWSLISEYVVLAFVGAPLFLSVGLQKSELRAAAVQSGRQKSGKGDASAAIPIALVVTALAALVVIWILGGERLAPTRRGQVYFATFVGFMGGTYLAASLADVSSGRALRALLASPYVAGIVGALYTAVAARLPDAWQHLNCIPLSPLVRPLPVEMIALGWLGIASTLHLRAAAAADARG